MILVLKHNFFALENNLLNTDVTHTYLLNILLVPL